MFSFDKTQKLCFVIDEDYYPLIFNFKNKYPELNIKIISTRELVDKAGYRFKDDPIPYLIKDKNIEYLKAKKLTNLIKYCRNMSDDGSDIFTYSKELEKDYLTVDEYGLYELNKYELYLFEMDENRGIKTLLNNVGVKYLDLHFDDLGIEEINKFGPRITNIHPYYFSGKFAQFTYIFSDIRNRLLKDMSLEKKIKILVKDSNDYFFISSLMKTFGLEFYFMNEKPLSSYPSIKKELERFYLDKKIEVVDTSNEDVQSLNDIINTYHLDELDFDWGYMNLVEILSSKMIKEPSNDKGILVTDKYTFKPGDEVYITNFCHGCFYQEYDDKNFYSDAELVKLGLTASYDKTALDERKKYNYLRFNNIALLSRVKQHLNDAIYSSQFEKSLYFVGKDEQGKYSLITQNDKIDELNFEGLFKSESKTLVNAHRLDQLYYDEKIDNGDLIYKTYDHAYQKVDASSLMRRDIWSVTALEKYFSCPFKYYLDELIKLPSDFHHRCRGTLIHCVFENILHSDYDFEEAFQKGKRQYVDDALRIGAVLTNKERSWFKLYHHWLKRIVNVILETKTRMKLVENKNDAERTIHYYIDGFHFKGKIDKLVYTTYNGELYYTIVDYKTGHEEYSSSGIVMGKSIQLPLYYYAIISQDDPTTFTDGGTFGGFTIQHNFFSKISKGFVEKNYLSTETLLKNLKFSGLSLNDESYLKSFDELAIKTVKDENTGNDVEQYDAKNNMFINITTNNQFSSVDDDSTLIAKSFGLDRLNINDIVNISKKAAINIIHKIIDNEFEIAPAHKDDISAHPKKSDELACEYCDHSNICYVDKSKDKKDYYDYIRKQLKKEVSENE